MSEGRCDSVTTVPDGSDVRCVREHGHGGSHSATIDREGDPYIYVVSWWPTSSTPPETPVGVGGDPTEGAVLVEGEERE